nr:MAG: hypothetical protein EDM05_15570 [Leptolyngbya sp. IPPAS B-1204]
MISYWSYWLVEYSFFEHLLLIFRVQEMSNQLKSRQKEWDTLAANFSCQNFSCQKDNPVITQLLRMTQLIELVDWFLLRSWWTLADAAIQRNRDSAFSLR